MLPFFRKIRYNLAKDNQFLKYSRYAIGEIVLVVIGILIALQVNDWNKERINRDEEKAYLNRLVQNLNRDLYNVKGSSRVHEETLINCTQVLDSMGIADIGRLTEREAYVIALKNHEDNQVEIPITLGEQFFDILRIRLFYKSDIAFQELLSTGKIDIIKNQELKSAIQEHYLLATEYQNFQDNIVMAIQNNFRDALIKNNISSINKESYVQLKDRITDPTGLIVAVENYMGITVAILDMFIYSENSLQKSTEQLIHQISNELNKSNN